MKPIRVTPGMANVLKGKGKVRQVCPHCGLHIPVYRGKYPSRCPSCGVDFLQDKEQAYATTVEDFISCHSLLLWEHQVHSDEVLRDLLLFNSLPYLSSIESQGMLLEAIYSIVFPAGRLPQKKHYRLFECSLTNNDSISNYLAVKNLGLHPSLLVSESDLQIITTESVRFQKKFPEWLEDLVMEDVLPLGRQRQILAESYLFGRRVLTHMETLSLANSFLCEAMQYFSFLPPSSILNPDNRGHGKRVVGGFRFQVNKDKKGHEIRQVQRKIISKRNQTQGVGSRIASARQMIQRRRAQKKATKWHKSGGQAGRLHRDQGRLYHNIHRSKGTYEAQEHKMLKRISEEELHIRAFSDGRPYTTGKIFRFEITGPTLFESEMKVGTQHYLKQETVSAVFSPGGKHTRLPVGTLIEITDLTPAEQWRGDYPSPPMGNYIMEIKVLSGPYSGAYIEVDGRDLAYAIGLEEAVKLHSDIKRHNGIFPSGAVYIQEENSEVTEVVVSAHESLLSPVQVGAVLETVGCRGRCRSSGIPIRVYNDPSDLQLLQEEFFLSALRGVPMEYSPHLLVEADGRVKELKSRYDQDVRTVKDNYSAMRTTLRQQQTANRQELMKQVSDRERMDLERLRKEYERNLDLEEAEVQVAASGTGGEELQSNVEVRDLHNKVGFVLPRGTRVNKLNGKMLVLSGPFMGRMVAPAVVESLMDLSRVVSLLESMQ